MKAKRSRRLFFRHLPAILLLSAAWEIGVRVSGVSPLLLPPLSIVLSALAEGIISGELTDRVLFSLLIIAEGLGIGFFVSLLLAGAARVNQRLSDFVESLAALFHPLPGIAVLPLVILWSGTGTLAVVLIIVHSVLWPLTTNLSAGFTSVPAHLSDVARNYRLSPGQLLFHLYLPAALPFLIAGIRIAWARAWRALIAAEMVFGAVGARGGLGWFIFQRRVFMDTTGLFAGIITVMLIGILVEELVFERLERLTIRRWGLSR
jgi:NitT/TauT family transport system permease protein